MDGTGAADEGRVEGRGLPGQGAGTSGGNGSPLMASLFDTAAAIVVVEEPQNTVALANAAAVALAEGRPEGRPFKEAFPRLWSSSFGEMLARAQSAPGVSSGTALIVPPAGSAAEPLRLAVHVEALPDAPGKPARLLLHLSRDAAVVAEPEAASAEVTAEPTHLHELHVSADQVRGFYEALACGVLIRDASGELVEANRAAQELFGLTFDEMRNRTFDEFGADVIDQSGRELGPDERPTVSVQRTGRPMRAFVLGVRRPDGGRRWMQGDAAPLAGPSAAAGGVLVSFIDVTPRVRAEEELRTSEARFRALTEHASDALVVLEPDGIVRYVSRSAERISGLKPEELVGKRLGQFIHDDDREAIWLAIATLLARPGGFVTAEFRFRQADGGWRTLGAVAQNMMADPDIAAIVINARDITDRKRSEERLQRLAAIVESSDDAIVGYDLDGRIVSWNGGAERLYGYAADEVIGLKSDAFAAGAADDVAGLLARVVAGESVQNDEAAWTTRSGAQVVVSLTFSVVRDAAGRLAGVSGIARDITALKLELAERQRSEQALQASEDRYRELFENASDIVYTYNLEGNFTSVNRAGLELMGYSRDEVLRLNLRDVLSPAELELGAERTRRRLAGEETASTVHNVRTRDGRWLQLETSARPMYVDGVPVGEHAIARNVTERQRSEELLRRQNDYLAALHETTLLLMNRLDVAELLETIITRAALLLKAPAGFIYLVDEEAQLLRATAGVGDFKPRLGRVMHRGEGLTGRIWESGEPLAIEDYATWEGVVDDPLAAAVHAMVGVPLISGTQVMGVLGLSHLRKGLFFAEDEISVLRQFAQLASVALDNARLYNAAQLDLAERRRAEEALAASARENLAQKTELEGIIAHLGDGLMLADPQGRVTLLNPAACTILGLTAAAALPGQAEAAYWQAVSRGGLTARSLPLARALRGDRGPAREVEIGVGGQMRVISASGAALQSAAGGMHGAVAVLRDVTAARRAQERVKEGERLRALGEMASGVAHDFNNMLAVILGRTELLSAVVGGLAEQPRLGPHVEVIAQAARDGEETVKRLQAFGGVARRPAMGVVDVGAVVRDVVEFTRPRWKDRAQQQGVTIQVETALEPLPPLEGNAAELREVLVNMVFNAVDALPEGGVLRLGVRRVGEEIEVRVTDTGVGMAESVRRRVFDPFFSTKGPGGTGLGLSMSYGIIARQGGRIEVESAERVGTTFRVLLPYREVGALGAAAEVGAGRGLAVLVVDDEGQMRETTQLLLEADGHEVTAVASGAAALAAMEGRRAGGGREYDVVLTDLGMGEMNGMQLVGALRSGGYTMPCVLVTGWGSELGMTDVAGVGAQGVLPKPFSLAQLRAVLAEVVRDGEMTS